MTDNNRPIEKLMTPQEVADLLGVSKKWVYNLVSEGRLQAVKLGRLLRFRHDQVETFIAAEVKTRQSATSPEA